MRTLLILFLACPFLAHSQERKPARDTWNQVFIQQADRELQPNEFLMQRVKGMKPGKVLDIGMGEGRNAIYLASLGWDVTGIDISDVAINQAEQRASKRQVKVKGVVADVDTFDYGRGEWDLVIGMYMHSMITRNSGKIVDSLKPGGALVIEGLHRDHGHESVTGGRFGYTDNELTRVFDGLHILFYQQADAKADWGAGGISPVVRLHAVKP